MSIINEDHHDQDRRGGRWYHYWHGNSVTIHTWPTHDKGKVKFSHDCVGPHATDSMDVGMFIDDYRPM